METITKMENIESLNKNVNGDFYKVPFLKFDIKKLRGDLAQQAKERAERSKQEE